MVMRRALSFSLLFLSLSCTELPDSYTPESSQYCNGKRVFLAGPHTSGNFSADGGIDAYCQSNKPSGLSSTFKAMMVGSTRVACTSANCGGGPSEHTDWVLTANTTYCSMDLTRTLGTTNSNAIFDFPINYPFNDSAFSIYTGFFSDWTTATSLFCSNWSVTGGNASIGTASGINSTFISSGTLSCGTGFSAYIYCVEQ